MLYFLIFCCLEMFAFAMKAPYCQPSNLTKVVNELHERMNRLGEPEFNSWWEQLLVRLYKPRGRTLNFFCLILN